MHNPIIKDILSNGRHYGMTLLVLCQYLNQMHPENRDQLDYLGMLYTSNQKNVRKVHEEYVNICDMRTFKCVLNACTSNRGMCYIDNTKNPRIIEDCVFFKQMPWPCNFAPVGSKEVRDYGNIHYIETQPKQNKKETVFNTNIDNNTDSDTCEDIPLALSNKCVFTDRKGSIIISKQNTQHHL